MLTVNIRLAERNIAGARSYTMSDLFKSLLVAYMLSSLVMPMSCIEESFCAGISYNDGYGNKHLGTKSMGATHWNNDLLNIIWGANHLKKEIPPDKLQLELAEVKATSADGSLRDMSAWLQIKIKTTRANDKIYALAIWALSEPDRESVGEFVNLGAEICTKNNWASPESLIPCSATPFNSPTNPNMFIFVAATESSAITEVKVMWKADFSVCNTPSDVRFLYAANSQKWRPLSSVTPFGVDKGLVTGWGPTILHSGKISRTYAGPAQPVFDVNKITCPFIYIRRLHVFEDEWYLPRWKLGTLEEQESAVNTRFVCKADEAAGFVDFGGRCPQKVNGATRNGVKGSLQAPPKCDFKIGNFHTDIKKNFQGHFKDFVSGQRKNQLNTGCLSCPTVPLADEVIKVATTSRSLERNTNGIPDALPYEVEGEGCHAVTLNLTEDQYNLQGLCRRSVAGKHAHGVRVWHASTHLLCAVVLIPVSCFMARYLKERLPISPQSTEPYLAIKPWYIVHIVMALPVFCMYLTSTAAVERSLGILGRSLNEYATFHRHAGVAIMTLYVFQCCSGFIRPRQMTFRKCWIFIHWFIGYVVYYGSVVLCTFTYRIPASPLSFHSILESVFPLIYYHIGPMAILAWLGVDILIHIFVTAHIIRFDRVRLHDNTGTYFPVILPMRMDAYHLRTEEDFLHEDRFLQKTFIVYLGICSGFFIMMAVIMNHVNSNLEQGFGAMECTHDDDGVFVAGETNSTSLSLFKRRRFCLGLSE